MGLGRERHTMVPQGLSTPRELRRIGRSAALGAEAVIGNQRHDLVERGLLDR
jgi:hypothetical protein